MSLSRKLLESMGLESDKVSTIIDAHVETVDALKEQISTLKSENADLESKKDDYEAAKAELEALKAEGGDWQAKYEAEHSAFEEYKAQQEAIELKNTKEQAYRELLKDAGVSEKRIDSILKVTNLDDIEIEDGKVKDSETVTEAVKTEWADFITSEDVQGATTPTPPAGGTPQDLGALSMEAYIAARKKS